MNINDESWLEMVQNKMGYGLKVPSFSHWTLAYALSLSGRLITRLILFYLN